LCVSADQAGSSKREIEMGGAETIKSVWQGALE
jgi:hypothetical protein